MDWLIIISRVWELYIFNPEPEYIDHWPTNVYLPTSECVWLISILGRWEEDQGGLGQNQERERTVWGLDHYLSIWEIISNTIYNKHPLHPPLSAISICNCTLNVFYQIWDLMSASDVALSWDAESLKMCSFWCTVIFTIHNLLTNKGFSLAPCFKLLMLRRNFYFNIVFFCTE